MVTPGDSADDSSRTSPNSVADATWARAPAAWLTSRGRRMNRVKVIGPAAPGGSRLHRDHDIEARTCQLPPNDVTTPDVPRIPTVRTGEDRRPASRTPLRQKWEPGAPHRRSRGSEIPPPPQRTGLQS